MKNILLRSKAFHTPFYTILLLALLSSHLVMAGCLKAIDQPETNSFPMVDNRGEAAAIYLSANDYPVIGICAEMLADDIERVTGKRPTIKKADRVKQLGKTPIILAGTIGHSALIDELIASGQIDVNDIEGKWEASLTCTIRNKKTHQPLLVVAGSDRRGTAFGLTSLCRIIGVSPWYWWADVTPAKKSCLYLSNGRYVQSEPSVQYRGIFINDERFGGWARWAEQHFEKETGKVGPKTYQRVFELLLRLRANYLWPAMHPGTQAFNADPENARLADQYAIVMGTSHCEQMLRNNEGEWKAVDEQARRESRVPPMGDFNYITNRETMLRYWEERIRTNGQYENTYTLGLRGIHDYPMEGANTTAERVRLMQQAINDQRDILRRHINKPIEEIPQVLCTYEEVLDAYHNGLQVPDDVTMLWSDDKQGYMRNLSNPEERKRKGGAGIYYHLSYHGDPDSWFWLSPLSPALISTELTKAYEYGARKIWVFNVGDIKPAEKEISLAMELAWDINSWKPTDAHRFTEYWIEETLGKEVAEPLAKLQNEYYRLMAYGKEFHTRWLEYTEDEITERLKAWNRLYQAANEFQIIQESHRTAYQELFQYPILGAAMMNNYVLYARRSMVRANPPLLNYKEQDADAKLADANRMWLDVITDLYNESYADGKWNHFFNWHPNWYLDGKKEVMTLADSALLARVQTMPTAMWILPETVNNRPTSQSSFTFTADKDGVMPLWIKARTGIRNNSFDAVNNEFATAHIGDQTIRVSAVPHGNIWHTDTIGPLWSQVGEIRVQQGENTLTLSEIESGTQISAIYAGIQPPFACEPIYRTPAHTYSRKHDATESTLTTIPLLGYQDGVTALPFLTPSYEPTMAAPWLEYELPAEVMKKDGSEHLLEVRTLPTLRIYEGRDARYAVSVDDATPVVFSIHEGDYTSEWRWNVLRNYTRRFVSLPAGAKRIRIYLLDPGIVLQEICVH